MLGAFLGAQSVQECGLTGVNHSFRSATIILAGG
jgi:hypothetical protein